MGLAAASHDLVGLVHSDTIFLERGWDKRWFGRLVNADLAALGTLEREANPFRPMRKRAGDWLRHLRHNPRPGPAVEGKLMYHFLLTRKSTLTEIGFTFCGTGTSRRATSQAAGTASKSSASGA